MPPPRLAAGLAVIAGILVLSLVCTWRPSPSSPPEQPLAAPSPPHDLGSSQESATHHPATNPPSHAHTDIAAIHVTSIDAPADVQIETITRRADLPDPLKARVLIQMLPALPEEALARAAEEAASRLPDADYAAVLLPIVREPRTHGAAMGVLFADLMERPDAIALPTLLAIARQPAHPFSATARENLALLLGTSYAEDWPRWETEIRKRLAPPP
jgi:hypothetical protein